MLSIPAARLIASPISATARISGSSGTTTPASRGARCSAAIYGYTAAGMGMGNGLGSIYVDGNHAVQGGCQVFDEAFSSILDELKAAKTIEEYYTGAAKLQDYYAAHMPLIALYWDNMMLAYSSKLDNVTVDAVFGLNNVNNWFSITKK